VQVIERRESFCVALLSPIDHLRFAEPVALSLPSVAQVAFCSRTL